SLFPEAVASDSITVTVGATAVAPSPFGLTIVAELAIVSPAAAPPPTVTSNTTVSLSSAATSMPWTSSSPAPFAPPTGNDASVLPAGKLTTVKPPTPAGMTSVTLAPDTAPPPVSTRVTVYRSTSPGSTSPPLTSSTVMVEVERSGCRMVAASVLPDTAAPPSTPALATVATLSSAAGAARSTETLMVSPGKSPPPATDSVLVQVTTCPMAPQLQPVPPLPAPT